MHPSWVCCSAVTTIGSDTARVEARGKFIIFASVMLKHLVYIMCCRDLFMFIAPITPYVALTITGYSDILLEGNLLIV